MPNPTRIIIGTLLITLLFPQITEARRKTRNTFQPTILSRAQWDADEAWGIANGNQEQTQTSTALQQAQTLSDKQKKCLEISKKHPEDFRVGPIIVKENEKGQALKWHRRYSPDVKLLVIHHTGEYETVETAKLSGKERVRAIYKHHALSNGWGDIGYHFLIDSDGTIYEGRAGGERVVGAHAYCANVATLGIALIGNFQRRYPSDEQLQSLRWLLDDLASEYKIRLNGRVSYHGKMMPTVVAHRDVGNTQCAGRYFHSLLPTIRRLTARGDFTSRVIEKEMISKQKKVTPKKTYAPKKKQGFRPIGSINLTLPPGGAQRLRMRYDSPDESKKPNDVLAKIHRSDRSIGLWHNRDDRKVRITNSIKTQERINRESSAYFDFTLLAPRKAGMYTLDIGGIRYVLDVQGRRMR